MAELISGSGELIIAYGWRGFILLSGPDLNGPIFSHCLRLHLLFTLLTLISFSPSKNTAPPPFCKYWKPAKLSLSCNSLHEWQL